MSLACRIWKKKLNAKVTKARRDSFIPTLRTDSNLLCWKNFSVWILQSLKSLIGFTALIVAHFCLVLFRETQSLTGSNFKVSSRVAHCWVSGRRCWTIGQKLGILYNLELINKEKVVLLSVGLLFFVIFFLICSQGCSCGKYTWRDQLFRQCTIPFVSFPRLDEFA